jgi:hypothetical protein
MDSIGKDLVKAAESVKKIYYWEKIWYLCCFHKLLHIFKNF